MRIVLAGSLRDLGIADQIRRWADADLMKRLWSRDPTVWAAEPADEITNRLGWLNLPESSTQHIAEIEKLAAEARTSDITHVVLCGMGGSSLAPEVFAGSLPTAEGCPDLIVLDSTHPDAVNGVADRIDLTSTWFIIASKSGGTLETRSFMEFFWESVTRVSDSPGAQFIAITDPGSELATIGRSRDFRAVFLADPDVGGRYSALTHFGLVPAALIGADIDELLRSARSARAMCGPKTPLSSNPAMEIGAALAGAVTHGRGTVRFVGAGPGAHFGVWVEQLIAESTGKSDTGIVPVDHGPDRKDATDEIVVSVGSISERDSDVTIEFDDPYDIGGAMFIMELATAIAGEILGIHPFNQPDVQRAKQLTSEAMEGAPSMVAAPLPIRSASVGAAVAHLLDGASLYISIQAYVDPTPDATRALDRLRGVVAARTGLPVTVGFGPRFLHSTGQLHKGGPAGGVFVQLVDQPSVDIGVPAADFTFNTLIEAQAAGDRQALADAGRSLVSIDLGSDAPAAIIALSNRLEPSS